MFQHEVQLPFTDGWHVAVPFCIQPVFHPETFPAVVHLVPALVAAAFLPGFINPPLIQLNTDKNPHPAVFGAFLPILPLPCTGHFLPLHGLHPVPFLFRDDCREVPFYILV